MRSWRDETRVRSYLESGKAIEISRETLVRVERDSSNDRRIRIQEGPHSGKTAWVPFEWLKPARAGNPDQHI